jgi:hypothetical protein
MSYGCWLLQLHIIPNFNSNLGADQHCGGDVRERAHVPLMHATFSHLQTSRTTGDIRNPTVWLTDIFSRLTRKSGRVHYKRGTVYGFATWLPIGLLSNPHSLCPQQQQRTRKIILQTDSGARLASFPGDKAAGAWSWPFAPASAEVKKMCIYISTPPHVSL